VTCSKDRSIAVSGSSCQPGTVHRICTEFAPNWHRICTVFARYPVQVWDMVTSTEINLRRVLVGHR
jgi:hypothetical protein